MLNKITIRSFIVNNNGDEKRHYVVERKRIFHKKENLFETTNYKILSFWIKQQLDKVLIKQENHEREE